MNPGYRKINVKEYSPFGPNSGPPNSGPLPNSGSGLILLILGYFPINSGGQEFGLNSGPLNPGPDSGPANSGVSGPRGPELGVQELSPNGEYST